MVVLQLLVVLSGLAASAAALALGGWLLARRREKGAEAVPLAICMVFAAIWAMADAAFGPLRPITQALLDLNGLAWLWLIHCLLRRDDRGTSVSALRLLLMATALAQLLQIPLVPVQISHVGGPGEGLILQLTFTLRLLACIGVLVLVHNLYAGASAPAREDLRWPAAGLAAIWLFDLNLATVGYISTTPPLELAQLRGLAMLVAILLFAIGASRANAKRRFSPSRSVAFQSFSLMMIGAYLLAMMLVSEGLSLAGVEATRAVQFGFLAVAGALALVILPSERLRGHVRVTLSKHLFQHRYDYRAEWLRFNDTMGRPGSGAAPLRERIVKAVADATDSPGGALLVRGEDGGLVPDAVWQWGGVDLPAGALEFPGTRFLEDNQFIVDLDDVRQGRAVQVPPSATPEWLLRQHDIWAMVPLLHFDRLLGVVLLARPPVARRLDWEDFDLLRVVGRQLASYLAEQASQDALGEVQRFDEFNRRIAFVMHDIKNLTSQLSLLARNAERHADNPAFRADMLVTLRNSADKLEALLARLSRYRTQGSEAGQQHLAASAPIDVNDLLRQVAARHAATHPVVVVERPPAIIEAERESLEQALVHLVHNAVEASTGGTPVFLDQRRVGTSLVIEVIDSGCGMSAEFVRTSLFKPFQSTKANGFGIGAYEARELVRAMGGRLEVESREGLGTRFHIHLPAEPALLPRAQDTADEAA